MWIISLVCVSRAIVYLDDMVWLTFFYQKCQNFINTALCCGKRKTSFEENGAVCLKESSRTESSSGTQVTQVMSSHHAVETYLQGRHERAMVRLCALLWILKLEEEKMAQQELTNQHSALVSQVR